MFDIKVCGIGQSQYERDTWATKTIGMIDPDSSYSFTGTIDYHIEYFHDIEESTGQFIAPTIEQIGRFMVWAKTFTEDDRVLVHCHAGISRSTAVAIGVLVLHGMEPIDAFMHIQSVRPQLYPNKLIISQIDEILGKNGEMMEAYKEWKKNNAWGKTSSGLIVPTDSEIVKEQKRAAARDMLKFMASLRGIDTE